VGRRARQRPPAAEASNLLTKYLRRDGLDFHLIWAAEHNPAGTGVHAHGGARGDAPLIERVSQACDSLSFWDVKCSVLQSD
jgi:hypothetical protein